MAQSCRDGWLGTPTDARDGLPSYLGRMVVDNKVVVQIYNGHQYYHLQDTDWQARDRRALIGTSKLC